MHSHVIGVGARGDLVGIHGITNTDRGDVNHIGGVQSHELCYYIFEDMAGLVMKIQESITITIFILAFGILLFLLMIL